MNDGEIFRQLESRATKAFALLEDPPVFVSGSGVRLTASDGRQYLDFASGSGTCNVGHGNPAVMAAVRELLDRGLTHVGPHFHADVQADFYRLLRKQLPAELTRFHPATNGTEATEAALKACMHATGARRFLAFEGGYHGRTLGSLAVSHARGSNAGLAPLAPEAEFIPFPKSAEDISLAVRTVGERPPGEPPLAGVIVEPIQATGGILLPPDGFLSALAATARSALVPLIVDEIFTGMGRTGRLFAFEAEGVTPDIVLLGKSLGGGFPGGVAAGREALMSAWPTGAQSSTFQLHPVTAAAGAAALRFSLKHDLCGRAEAIGSRIASWRARFCELPFTSSLRGVGAMFGLAMRPLGGAGAGEMARRVRRQALRDGLITWECGRKGEVIGLIPPLIATDDEVDEACGILLRALRSQPLRGSSAS